MLRRLGRVLALVCAVVILTPVMLYAHALLKRSTPSAGAVLERAPHAIELWFTEAVVLSGTRITLVAPDGREIPLAGVAFAGADHADVAVNAPDTLAAGEYTVRWNTAAADDGHASSGSFAFSVRGVTGAPAPAVAAPPGAVKASAAGDSSPGGISPIASRTLRWAEFMALIAVLGACVFRQLVVPRAGILLDVADRRTQRITAIAACVLIVTMVVRARVQSEIFGLGQGDGFLAIPWSLFHTSWGRGWSIGLAGAALCLGGISARALRVDAGLGWMVVSGGAVALAFYPGLTGHALANPDLRVVNVIADALHVGAVGAWIGMLFFVASVGIPLALRGSADSGATRVATLVTAFHPIALAAVITLALTGAVSACFRLGSLSALWTSDYGQVLTFKVAAFGLIALRGAYNWRVITPRLAQGGNAVSLIRRSIAAEILLGALVLAVSATLVSMPPPSSAATTPSASSASGSPSR